MDGILYDRFRCLPPQSDTIAYLQDAADRVESVAKSDGAFDEEIAGCPPEWFIDSIRKADPRWFADRDVQDILNDKIANLGTGKGSKSVVVAFKTFHAVAVESTLTCSLRAPYNKGAGDSGGFSNVANINKSRIVPGKTYWIFRLERCKSSKIFVDDVKCVITPDGVPGCWYAYRVLATAALQDHWEGCMIESRDDRGMSGVALDEKDRFLPIFEEGAYYKAPKHSATAIFFTGTDAGNKNGILDLRSKDFQYNEWVKPVGDGPTKESWVRILDRKRNSHDQSLIDLAMKMSSVSEAAAEDIKAKGAPEPGMRYNIVRDVVTEVCARTGKAHLRNPEQKRQPLQTGKDQTHGSSKATDAAQNQSSKPLNGTDRSPTSSLDDKKEDKTPRTPEILQRSHGFYPGDSTDTGVVARARHHGHQIEQWHGDTEHNHARPSHGPFQPRDLAHTSPFETGTDASFPTATATRVPLQHDDSDARSSAPTTTRKRSNHDDPGAERKKKHKPECSER